MYVSLTVLCKRQAATHAEYMTTNEKKTHNELRVSQQAALTQHTHNSVLWPEEKRPTQAKDEEFDREQTNARTFKTETIKQI